MGSVLCSDLKEELGNVFLPLTPLENCFGVRGNGAPYRGPFLLHYLDALGIPMSPRTLLWRRRLRALYLSIYVQRQDRSTSVFLDSQEIACKRHL